MSDLLTAIPEGYGSTTSRSHPTAVAVLSHPASAADLLSAPAREQNPRDGGTGDGSNLRGIDSNIAEPPEIPNTDGLTSFEFRLVADRAKDPFLDPKQRAGV